MATLNTAEWFQLHDRGAIAPGRYADLMIFADLNEPRAKAVYAGGRRASPAPSAAAVVPKPLLQIAKLQRELSDTNVALRPGRMRVIGLRPDQLITDQVLVEPLVRDGCAVADPERDVLKMMVVERHRGSNRVGVGFIRGFGLKRGAIAGTVAHDHHNIVAIGCTDVAMWAAATSVARAGGGLCVIDGVDQELALLPLPVGGLMSDRPMGEVADGYRKLLAAARSLGSPLHDPFMAMSFMALEVIPSLKLTDKGLVDVDAFEHVELFV
jgi:adenine deaminase